MPLSTEFVTNKPLTGPELVECVIRDTREALEKDAMFNSHVAYGKVGYKITVTLTLANPTYPEHTIRSQERKVDLEPKDTVEGLEIARTREIKSPNVARVTNQLPVKVQLRQDGKVIEKELRYDGEVVIPPQPEPIDSMRKI